MITGNIAKIQIGSKEIEGLCFSQPLVVEGTEHHYGIAVPQIVKLFPLSTSSVGGISLADKSQSSQVLRRLMGKAFQFYKVKTPFNKVPINIITIPQFHSVLATLTQRNNSQVIEFWNSAFPQKQIVIAKKSLKPKTQGYIYLFEGQNVLKLGYSTNILLRLRSLSRWDGELRVVLKRKGTMEQEKDFHLLLHSTGEYMGDEWYPLSRREEIIKLLKEEI